MRFLVVEDDEAQANLIKMALIEYGYVVDVVADGEAGWHYVEAFTYDLLLLNISLPKLDGISLCRRIRDKGYNLPILLLTAKDSSFDKVTGLEAGADDYVVKPCTIPEMIARIRALLRRRATSGAPELHWHDLRVNPSARQVTYGQQLVPLSPKEYSLLELFLRNPKRVLTQSAILEHLWSFESPPSEDTVRAHIKRLRRKLKGAGADDIIETVYGVGYRLKQLDKAQSEQSVENSEPENPQINPENTPSDSTPNPVNGVQPLDRRSPVSPSAGLGAMADSWERFKHLILSRMTKLEQTVTAVKANVLTEDLRRDAEIQAHKLAGSLGMFGLKSGYHLAQQVEQWLIEVGHNESAPNSSFQTLQTLVSQLHQELKQPPTFHLEDQPQSIPVQPPNRRAQNCVQQMPRVLVVDDDVDLTDQLQTAAFNWNIQLDVASNKAQARTAISETSPDLVLLDLVFSQDPQGGYSLLEELKLQFPKLPVLVWTVRDDVGDRAAVARLGGSAFLPKSMSSTQVLEAIMDILKPTALGETKVLAVDDDPVILDHLQQLLPSYGLEVTPLQDSREFWDTLEATAPDLLILDLEMPHFDGIELCRTVRQDPAWNAMPILFLSARKDPQSIQRIYQAGADDYISKPFSEAELITRIFNRLDRIQLLRSLAETDSLTGLTNRRRSIQDLNRYLRLSMRHHQSFCLALLDLDHFRRINDQYGYGVGDNVLRQLGQVLQQQFRGEDIVARWGGEEFLIGLYASNKPDGVKRIDQLLDTIRASLFPISGKVQIRITASAGISTYPEDGTDLPTLCAASDQALHQAKLDGGDRIIAIPTDSN